MTDTSKISRRELLAGAAATTTAVAAASLATAGFPTIVRASTLGRQGATPPSERLTIGFVGVGFQAKGHLNAFIRRPEVKVVAVCDVDTTRRENAKKITDDWYSTDTTYKGCDTYTDFRELLARKDIDAVLIGTPDHWHCAVAVAAVQHGKDVYCEKPLTLTIAEAKVLMDSVHKHKRILQTGSQQRSSQEFRIACEAVQNGRLGKIKQVYVSIGGPSRPCDLGEEPLEPGLDWNMWLGQAPERPYNSILSPRGVHEFFPNWRNYREFSGGGMTDWGAHMFDIAQWGLGMDHSGPIEIIPPDDVSKGVGVKYVYASGAEVIHGPYTDADGQTRNSGVHFVGETGSLWVDRGSLKSWPENIATDPLGANEKGLFKSPGHHQNWFDCIKSREQPICNAEVGARSVTVCHLGNLAYWNNRKLKWNPEKWHFEHDKEADTWRDRVRRDPWSLPRA